MIGEGEKRAIISLLPFLSGNPVIFDVGSNKGGFTDVVLGEFGDNCELHLFEPNEKLISFTEIKYEYRKNIIYNKVLAYKANVEQPFHFFENYNNELSSIYIDENWVKEGLPLKVKTVKCYRLDTYSKSLSINKIDYLKIDTEGSDIDVLLGCEELLINDKIKIIQIEYSEHYKRANRTSKDIFDIAEKYGYRVYRYIHDNFWEVTDITEYENYFITKHEIHNHSIGGWNSQFILNVEGLPKFDLILEIGAFEGLTTKYMCENMLNEGGRVNVVDPLMDVYVEGDTEHRYFKDQYARFKRNTRGLNIDLYRGKSEEMLPKLHELRHDFVYIDGDHFGDQPYFDGVWAFAITRPQGYILFDDYKWRPETQESIDRFLNEFSSSMDIIRKDYQVLIRKVTDQYNELTYEYYK